MDQQSQNDYQTYILGMAKYINALESITLQLATWKRSPKRRRKTADKIAEAAKLVLLLKPNKPDASEEEE